MFKYIPAILLSALFITSCGTGTPSRLTEEERHLISGSPEVMRVLTTASEEDSLFLRRTVLPLNPKDIASDEFETLSAKMLATLEEEDGVGIAGPQVGISRRIIAVMRYDKEGRPVEVFANPYITETRGEKELGPEGCLSVPNMRGDVPRWRDITISYSDPSDPDKVITEDVQGYTAIIFQHETDHLEGILYTDRL